MPTEQVRQSLESADESLRRAIVQLVEMRFGVPQCASVLDSAVENLRVALDGDQTDALPDSLRPLARSVRSRAARVQSLLDSAVSFYCGWATAAPAEADTYAADGQMLRDGGGGRLLLDA